MNKKVYTALVLTGIIAGAMAAPAAAQTGYVSADLLNVRSAPSTDSAVTDLLYQGEAVTITYGPSMGWYEIYHDGTCCYVSADFITDGSGSTWDGGSDPADDGYAYDAQYGNTYDAYESYEEESYEQPAAQSGTYLGNFTLTAYCSCSICTGGSGVTASGTVPTAGRTVAMAGVPFGTQLLINGNVYTVEDRGTSYGHVDIYFDNHQDAVNFGMQSADVYQLN